MALGLGTMPTNVISDLNVIFFLRSANLILNLFSLMLDAGVPDIALEPDKTVQKVQYNVIAIGGGSNDYW